MFVSRARRSKRQSKAAADAADGKEGTIEYKMVPEEELFKEIGFVPEVVRRARN